MTTSQRKIGSGFGARSTTADVLRGVELDGRLAIVTGRDTEAARALAGAGAEVVEPELDLGDLGSVRAFAEQFVASGRKVDIVLNNAEIGPAPEIRLGPGFEAHFARNHLGHYALVNLLWPALVGAEAARVVTVSSPAHQLAALRWDDPQFVRGYESWRAHAQSKTATALFAVHLDRLGRPYGVRAFAASGGAPTQVWAAASQRLIGLGGVYCENCDIAERTDRDDACGPGVRDHAIDPEQAAELWDLSAELTGIDAL